MDPALANNDRISSFSSDENKVTTVVPSALSPGVNVLTVVDADCCSTSLCNAAPVADLANFVARTRSSRLTFTQSKHRNVGIL